MMAKIGVWVEGWGDDVLGTHEGLATFWGHGAGGCFFSGLFFPSFSFVFLFCLLLTSLHAIGALLFC